MKVEIIQNEKRLDVKVSDRLDASTAPKLEEQLLTRLEGIEELKIDLSDLIYISSAGLRILLRCQKIMHEQGAMSVKGVSGEVKEVFEASGFDEILTLE